MFAWKNGYLAITTSDGEVRLSGNPQARLLTLEVESHLFADRTDEAILILDLGEVSDLHQALGAMLDAWPPDPKETP